MYWHVKGVDGTVERLFSLGATGYEPVTEPGPGFVTASVAGLFGSILGVMYNRHYLEVLVWRKS